MVNPNVRPPNPQRMPQNQHHSSVLRGVADSTCSRCSVRSSANTQGAISQLKTPPTIQKISHDHPRTRL